MHELAALTPIIQKLQTQAAAAGHRKIVSLELGVSKTLGTSHDHLQETFNVAAAGTILEGAEVAVQTLPFKMHCDDCGGDFEADLPPQKCPLCSSTDFNTLHQEEIVLLDVKYR